MKSLRTVLNTLLALHLGVASVSALDRDRNFCNLVVQAAQGNPLATGAIMERVRSEAQSVNGWHFLGIHFGELQRLFTGGTTPVIPGAFHPLATRAEFTPGLLAGPPHDAFGQVNLMPPFAVLSTLYQMHLAGAAFPGATPPTEVHRLSARFFLIAAFQQSHDFLTQYRSLMNPEQISTLSSFGNFLAQSTTQWTQTQNLPPLPTHMTQVQRLIESSSILNDSANSAGLARLYERVDQLTSDGFTLPNSPYVFPPALRPARSPELLGDRGTENAQAQELVAILRMIRVAKTETNDPALKRYATEWCDTLFAVSLPSARTLHQGMVSSGQQSPYSANAFELLDRLHVLYRGRNLETH